MHQRFAALRATDTQLLRPHFWTLLAEALGKARKTEEGLLGLKESAEAAHLNADASYLAEVYRIKGELLLIQATSRAEAEACFNRSIEIARQQKAKSLELRAVLSVVRLYQSQDKQEHARGLLAEIYDKFCEGFDTADLREAKTLLDELS